MSHAASAWYRTYGESPSELSMGASRGAFVSAIRTAVGSGDMIFVVLSGIEPALPIFTTVSTVADAIEGTSRG